MALCLFVVWWRFIRLQACINSAWPLLRLLMEQAPSDSGKEFVAECARSSVGAFMYMQQIEALITEFFADVRPISIVYLPLLFFSGIASA